MSIHKKNLTKLPENVGREQGSRPAGKEIVGAQAHAPGTPQSNIISKLKRFLFPEK